MHLFYNLKILKIVMLTPLFKIPNKSFLRAKAATAFSAS